VQSRCLNLEPVRWNGVVIENRFAAELAKHVELRSVCPEVGIGLGTPRATVRLLRSPDGDRLVQPASGRDFSDDMHAFSRHFLDGLDVVDGFLLKSQSPTCGIGNVKHYAAIDGGAAVGKTHGMFAAAVLDRFPHLPVEDEGRLQDAALRRHFLTRLFTLHRFRTLAGGRPGRGDLVQFHAEHKWLLLGYKQSRMRELGRLLAAGGDAAQQARAYGDLLGTALARRPSMRSQLNVLQHGLGYVSDGLTKAEKRHFLDLVDAFGAGDADLRPAQELLRSWLLRFEQTWALEQRWFDPFPASLMTA
jgi:uncharacterized protein YbgA (DUF1722 family)/uncharacterized protein YbbK (DUF523 family)